MLKIEFGVGDNLIDAAQRAVEKYNAIEGNKTFHTKEYSHYKSPENEVYQCEIWFTVHEPKTPVEQEEKHEFIGSTDIDPRDPDWHEKWKALQDASNEQAKLDQETADVDWRLNTDEFPEIETMEHIADR